MLDLKSCQPRVFSGFSNEFMNDENRTTMFAWLQLNFGHVSTQSIFYVNGFQLKIEIPAGIYQSKMYLVRALAFNIGKMLCDGWYIRNTAHIFRDFL